MSKKIVMNLLVASIVLMLCVVTAPSYAAENVDGSKTQGVEKTTTNDVYRYFMINNLFNWYSNCGDGSYNPNTLQSGFEFPKGSGKFCTFRRWSIVGRVPQRPGHTQSRWINLLAWTPGRSDPDSGWCGGGRRTSCR